jgi:hypothetical protein
MFCYHPRLPSSTSVGPGIEGALHICDTSSLEDALIWIIFFRINVLVGSKDIGISQSTSRRLCLLPRGIPRLCLGLTQSLCGTFKRCGFFGDPRLEFSLPSCLSLDRFSLVGIAGEGGAELSRV